MTGVLRSFFRRWEPNPVFLKELRQAVRSRYLVNTMLVYLAAAVLVAGGVTWYVSQNLRRVEVQDAGQTLMGFFAIIFFLLNILVAVYLQNRAAEERTQANVDLFFLTTMTPAAVIRGKMFAGMFLLAELYGLGLPFMAYAYLLRGVDVLSILSFYFGLFGVGVVIIAMGLVAGVLPLRKQARNAVTGVVLVLMFQVVPMVLVAAGLSGSRSPLAFLSGPGSLWGTVVLVFALWIGALAVLVSFAVTVLSPVYSNRFLPIRIGATTAWVLLGGACLFDSLCLWSLSALEFWLMLTAYGGVFFLAIGINEGEEWSPRIRRTIPRSRWLRMLVFPFYSGAANAIVWVVGLFGITLLVFSAGAVVFPAVHGPGGGAVRHVGLEALRAFWRGASARIAAGNILIFGYGVCYCLTALMIRRLFLMGAKKPVRIAAWTWVALLFLLAMGMLFPFAVHSLAGPDFSELKIGYLPSCYKSGDQWLHFYFLAFYSVIIGLYHLPWLFGRFLQFQPLEDSAPGAPESADAAAGRAS